MSNIILSWVGFVLTAFVWLYDVYYGFFVFQPEGSIVIVKKMGRIRGVITIIFFIVILISWVAVLKISDVLWVKQLPSVYLLYIICSIFNKIMLYIRLFVYADALKNSPLAQRLPVEPTIVEIVEQSEPKSSKKKTFKQYTSHAIMTGTIFQLLYLIGVVSFLIIGDRHGKNTSHEISYGFLNALSIIGFIMFSSDILLKYS